MQSLRAALFLAVKSITKGHTKAATALIIFILSLSFINLVFISSILYGVVDMLNKQMLSNITSNIVVDPQEEPIKKDYILHAAELRRQIELIPGVIATVRHYKLVGTLAYDKEKNGKFKIASAEVIGIDPEDEKRVTGIFQKVVDGHYLEGPGFGDILLGAALAGGYRTTGEFTSLGGAKVGDKVFLTFSNGVVRDYRVKGIFMTRFGFADRLAFITDKEAEAMLSVSNMASQILVRISGVGDEDHYMKQIHSLATNLKVRKWTDHMGALGDVTKSFDMIIFMVSGIGLAVASITIFILIYVNVVNRRRQIGVLKAIGIKQSIIVCSYALQALFFTISGIIIGYLLIFTLIAPYFTAHPLEMAAGDATLSLNKARIIHAALSLLVAALIAGFIPSRRAAKENILKAIWGM